MPMIMSGFWKESRWWAGLGRRLKVLNRQEACFWCTGIGIEVLLFGEVR